MIIDCKQYTEPCVCGQTHQMTTRLAVIEAGCLRDFEGYMLEQGMTGWRTAVYDAGTYHAQALMRPRADQEIILPYGMPADEDAAAYVLSRMSARAEVLIALGTGTVHSVVRHCASRLSKPYVSCPTAASSDGFCAKAPDVPALPGDRAALSGDAPVLVLADVDVLARAPMRLTRAGVGEAVGKFASLVDWKVSHLLGGEPMCPVAESMARQAAVAAQGCCELLGGANNEGAVAQLMYALLLSGLATQMQGSAHPASGAEHHMERLMELLPDAFGGKPGLLHGERIGALTGVVSGLYHQMGKIADIGACFIPYQPLDGGWLERWFGRLTPMIAEENKEDCLRCVTRERIVAMWPEIRRIIAEMPAREQITRLLSQAGAKASLAELGVAEAAVAEMLRLAPCVRNQLTLLRLLRLAAPPSAEGKPQERPGGRAKWTGERVARMEKKKTRFGG